MTEARARRSVADLRIEEPATVEAFDLAATDVAWLAAVGLFPGQTLWVLRRAALRGPSHVRVASGGDFALAHELTARILVAAPTPPTQTDATPAYLTDGAERNDTP